MMNDGVAFHGRETADDRASETRRSRILDWRKDRNGRLKA
jgi:hypothetical protein